MALLYPFRNEAIQKRGGLSVNKLQDKNLFTVRYFISCLRLRNLVGADNFAEAEENSFLKKKLSTKLNDM